MPDVWMLASILTKALMYFGFLTSGGLVLIRFAFPSDVEFVLPDMRSMALYCAAVALIASILSFALRGVALTGDATGLTDTEMLGMMWQTPVGTALVFRVVGAVLILAGLLLGGIGWVLAGTGALIALWSFVAIGHVSTETAIWPKIVLMVHLLAVAFWIGILHPLKRLADTPEHVEAAGRLGQRFGQTAMFVIPSLLVAGLLLSWLLVGKWSNLWGTPYGVTLLAKLCAVSVVLCLGAWNKQRSVPDLIAKKTSATAHLSRILSLDWFVFALVLTTTSWLTTSVAVPNGH